LLPVDRNLRCRHARDPDSTGSAPANSVKGSQRPLEKSGGGGSLPSGPPRATAGAGQSARGRRATSSISTLAPRGSAATCTVERAGLWAPKCFS
jgi:hypothetical protein